MRGHKAEVVPPAPPRRPCELSASVQLPRVSWLAARCAGLFLCVALAACQTDGPGMAGAGGRTLAFDTIDGPPPATFDKLVGDLTSEAQTRRVAVVSRSTPAAYRVKGYLAMHVERGKATVAYAWDVYDQNQTRVARVVGEEPAGPVKGGAANGWAACDDAVVARIADQSMASLAETLGASGAVPAAAPQPADTPRPDSGSGVPVAALTTPGSGLPASGAALAYADR